MNDKFFLDTNIIVYEFSSDPEKKKISKNLIKKAHVKNGCLSFQVIQEFLNVINRKFKVPLSDIDVKEYTSKVLFPICAVFPSEELYFGALDIKERWQFSCYDSLMISAAIEANCNILYSEDLQHNQKIYELTVVNPYI